MLAEVVGRIQLFVVRLGHFKTVLCQYFSVIMLGTLLMLGISLPLAYLILLPLQLSSSATCWGMVSGFKGSRDYTEPTRIS